MTSVLLVREVMLLRCFMQLSIGLQRFANPTKRGLPSLQILRNWPQIWISKSQTGVAKETPNEPDGRKPEVGVTRCKAT
jgi:hypothetical protein